MAQSVQGRFPTVRRWLKRSLLALLLLAGLYLLAANVFLNTPLASQALNRRPHRFQIHWRSAWSVWPGLVHARGLRVEGWRPNVAWLVTAERARGWIDLPALLHRSFRITDLHGEEVHSRVQRRQGIGRPDPPRQNPQPVRRFPWSLSFERVTLDHVRDFSFNGYRLAGDGRAEGSFGFVLGGEFRLEPSAVHMPAAQLWMDNDLLAESLDLEGEARLGPYKVRDHPGLEAFDFFSGTVKAQGRVPELPFLDRAGLPGGDGRKPGTLTVDFRIAKGHLLPDSRFELSAPADGQVSPFVLTTIVSGEDSGTLLRLGLEAQGLSAGRRPNGPPLFRSRVLSVAAKTSETRLSRIFATTRDIRQKNVPLSLPLVGDVRGEGLQIEAPGTRAHLRATVDHAAGRVDLAGLLNREIQIEGLLADGFSARLEVPKPLPGPPPPAAEPLRVRIDGARFNGVRELSLGDFLLAGDMAAETTFSYDRDGTLAVDRTAFSLKNGSFRADGQPAAQNLFLTVETRIEPSILGRTQGAAFLRYVSGTGSLRGRINSLGFLDPYFEKTPWLKLRGQGGLEADIHLDHGRLDPGSRIAISATPVQAMILDSLATGRGTIQATVSRDKGGKARTSLAVRFDRFGFADLRRKGRPDYLRGQGLRISATRAGALDLTGPVPHFDATIDLPDAQVPDLAVFDALLPAGAGFAITGGTGRVKMHLEVEGATSRTRGTVRLSSNDARVQVQNLLLRGDLDLKAPLSSPNLAQRGFDLAGTRLELGEISYRDVDSQQPAEESPWWARALIERGSIVWGTPLSLRGEGRVEMKNTGPLLELFSERSRAVRWFDDVLNVENVTARGVLKMGEGLLAIESLQATGGPLEVRSRMMFSKERRQGDLYVRYRRLAVGIELRDGQRDLKLRKALEWYESRSLDP